MKKPLVSIVITCYNYANYVAESIESALAQSYSNVEVIAIDDGSTDNSLEIIKQYSKKIKIVTRENKGIVYTRNEALEIAKGDFLCFLDADDYFDSDYIEKMVTVAQESKADVVYPNWHIFGDEVYTKTFPEFELQKLVEQEIHCTAESLIRISAVRGHKFESEKVAEDWDFFLGLALAGKRFKLAGDCYINYRVKKGGRGTTNPYWDDMYSFVAILEKWQKVYPEKITPIDLPIYAGRVRDDHISSQNDIIHKQDDVIREKAKVINKQDKVIAAHESTIEALARDVDVLRAENLRMVDSVAYRVGNKAVFPARLAKRVAGGVKQKVKRIQAKRIDSGIDKSYASQVTPLKDVDSASKIAVVVHLFYLDNWPLFLRKLKLLPVDMFDLYITIPEQNTHFVETIHQDFPGARTVISPNRGRDVLPFIKVAELINHLGYRSILKFHSKKSTHWSGGQDWLEATLDAIIPDDKESLDKILDIAINKEYGVLGPKEFYYPLTINYPANSRHLREVLDDLYGKDMAESTLDDRREYGFFGGTMFWMNVSAIEPLLRYSGAAYFEEEAGQVDGTFAHAIERLLTLVPEMDSKDIYETDGVSVIKRLYKSKNIPEWSQDHNK